MGPQCTHDCVGHSTEHDMSKCEKNCVCMGGNCDMSSCTENCSCPIWGFDKCGVIQVGPLIGAIIGIIVIIGLPIGIFFYCRKKKAANQQKTEYGEVPQSKD